MFSVAIKIMNARRILSAGNIQLCHVWGHPLTIQAPFFFITVTCLFTLAVLAICCFAQAFSSCREQGAALHCDVPASHCGAFSCCRGRVLGTRASVVGAYGLGSCGL